MGRVIGKALLIQLTSVETVHEKLQGCFQRFRTTRKAARTSSQASQVMTQFGIVCFDRVGVGFPLRDFIHAPVIPQAIIGIKSIAVVAFGLRGFVDQFLNDFLRSLPNHSKAKIAASEAIYDRDDVDLVFFSPIKLNNSSISASLTWSGTGGSGSWAAWALTHRETVRW
jgi:hypothetical protein